MGPPRLILGAYGKAPPPRNCVDPGECIPRRTPRGGWTLSARGIASGPCTRPESGRLGVQILAARADGIRTRRRPESGHHRDQDQASKAAQIRPRRRLDSGRSGGWIPADDAARFRSVFPSDFVHSGAHNLLWDPVIRTWEMYVHFQAFY